MFIHISDNIFWKLPQPFLTNSQGSHEKGGVPSCCGLGTPQLGDLQKFFKEDLARRPDNTKPSFFSASCHYRDNETEAQ
jgi:hypothetical protein